MPSYVLRALITVCAGPAPQLHDRSLTREFPIYQDDATEEGIQAIEKLASRYARELRCRPDILWVITEFAWVNSAWLMREVFNEDSCRNKSSLPTEQRQDQ